MRKKRTLRRAAALAALLLAGGLAAGWFRLCAALPDTFTLAPGQALTVGSLPFLQAGAPSAGPAAAAGSVQADTSRNQTLRLFGVVPVKTVRTVETPRRTVTVSGAKENSPF